MVALRVPISVGVTPAESQVVVSLPLSKYGVVCAGVPSGPGHKRVGLFSVMEIGVTVGGSLGACV